MKQLLNMLYEHIELRKEFNSSNDIENFIKECHCDGLEVIYGGTGDCPLIESQFIVGWHLLFYADWIDFWYGRTEILDKKFVGRNAWHEFFRGTDRSALIEQFSEDLDRAKSFGAEYVVFHVSDVSVEETVNYKWLHSDEEVIDTAAEFINLLLDNKDYDFYFLMENLWWPGFSFAKPEMTKRILNKVNYSKKGIMLDTGHLINVNLDIKSQEDGIDFINRMLDAHGDMVEYIKGVHLHQSVSGEFTKAMIKNHPTINGGYFEKFAQAYKYIFNIDTHQPFTTPKVKQLIDRISPDYLVHELSTKNKLEKKDKTLTQIRALSSK